jgi:hypothetical protein
VLGDNRMKLNDIYEENGIYFIVVELKNGNVSKAIPLSRWVLKNYIGSTQDALNVYENYLLEQISKAHPYNRVKWEETLKITKDILNSISECS